MAVDLNTVPLGQAGTGAAFVLGNSQAADQFAQTQARNQQYAYQNALRQQQEAAKKAALWQQNALKVEGGLYWKPEFDKMYQTHLEDGIKLRQSGINPYDYNPNDPNQSQKAQDYLLQRQGILKDSADRKATETQIAKRFNAITANPSKYEPEDIDALNEYINTPYSQAKNIPIPTLREAFNVDRDLVTKLDPVTFQTSKTVGNTKIEENKMLVEPTKRNIETLIADTDTGKRWIKRQTGLTPSEAKNIPDSFESNKKRLMEEYKGNPDIRSQLAADFGITGEGQELDDLLNQQAMEDVRKKQAYNSVINQYTELARAKANEFVKTNPDYRIEDQAMQRRGLQLREEANNRAIAKFNERDEKETDDATLYRQKTIEDMLGNVEGSGERLKSVLSATGNFNQNELNQMIGAPKGSNFIEFRIPEKTISYKNSQGEDVTKTLNKRTVLIDKSKPDSKLKLNQLLNDLTGEKISESKVQTGNAGGKVKGEVFTEKGKIPKSVTNKFKNVPKGGF